MRAGCRRYGIGVRASLKRRRPSNERLALNAKPSCRLGYWSTSDLLSTVNNALQDNDMRDDTPEIDLIQVTV